MTEAEMREALAAMRRIKMPITDAFKVHSQQEVDQLREFVEWGEHQTNPFAWQHFFGIPIYIDPETPPGVLRCMSGDDVLVDEPIR